MSCAKSAKAIEMPFGMWTRIGPGNHVLDRVQIPTREWAILRAKGAGPGHVRTRPAVDILKATQQGAALVRCRCRLGRNEGAH